MWYVTSHRKKGRKLELMFVLIFALGTPEGYTADPKAHLGVGRVGTQ